MRTATISEAKDRLSALLDQVRAGESVVILDRGVPVARIEPVVSHPDATGRLRRLQRAGIVRVGDGASLLDLPARPAPRMPPGSGVVAALLEERRSSR